MYELIDINLEEEMNKAFHYLSKNLLETGHNSKPVLMHSIAVSMTLYSLKYPARIVISAILHDLIEDTEITYEDIQKEFTTEIADIVRAVSFDPKIKDKLEQAKKMFEGVMSYGKDALIVKCADLFSNMPFIKYVNNPETKEYLRKKYALFIEMAQSELKSEPIFNYYINRYNELIKNND